MTILDGEITQVNDTGVFNPVSFVEHVEKPTTRYIVRNKDLSENGDLIKKEQVAHNCNNAAENDIISANKGEDKSQNET